MNNITHINPIASDLIKTLEDALEDARKGDISGIILVCEHEDRQTLDMPGAFSADTESLAGLVGRLQIANHYFSSMAYMDEDEEDYEH